MANGFGGSPGLALLTGLAQGINEREERQRARAREDLIDTRTRAAIDESRQRLRNMRDAEKQRELERQKAEADAAALEASQQYLAGLIRSESPDIDDEGAMHLARILASDRQQSARVVANIMFPDDTEEDELSRQRLSLQIEEMQEEIESARQIRNLANSPEGERLRSNFMKGDETGTSIARRAAIGSGFNPTAIDQYLSTLTPTDKAGRQKPTPEQRRAAQMRGSADAEQLVREMGSVEAAINAAQRAIQGADPDNLIILAELDGLLRRLEEIRENDEMGGTLRSSDILRNPGG